MMVHLYNKSIELISDDELDNQSFPDKTRTKIKDLSIPLYESQQQD
jgi:hypothetical protein